MTTATTLTVADYLKYANLQMAAEAFLFDPDTGQLKSGQRLLDALWVGNEHASRFTPTQAKDFADPVKGWTVVDQCPNTDTGFSGTLFRNNQTGELVVSFRSTEFIDDSARDNQATNTQEIKELGFAFGQISDMEDWYQNKVKSLLPAGTPISVTGYSLGGHLATAFHILHANDTVGTNTPLIKEVVTFNGAGIGTVTPDTTLAAVMQQFNTMRATDYAANITYQPLKDIYERTRLEISCGGSISDADQVELNKILRPADGSVSSVDKQTWDQAKMLQSALSRIDEQRANVVFLKTITSGVTTDPNGNKPAVVPNSQIIQEDLDYQMAVLTVSQSTSSASILAGLLQAYGNKNYGPLFPNQFDIVGDTTPSAVSNSQTHLGFDVRIPIEDQPLYRGGDPGSAAWTSLFNLSIKLLVDKYAYKDFGDTHSLVLIVDSLSVLNTLLQLTPEDKRSTALPTLASIFKSSSYLQKVNGDAINLLDYTQGQGKAEGDVLENLVNSLADLAFGIGNGTRLKPGNPDGGTWATTKNILGEEAAKTYKFSTRDDLHTLLDGISKSKLFLEGVKGTLIATSALQQRTVRTDFGAFAALYTLSPFALIGAGSALEGAVGDGWTSIKSEWLADRSAKQSSPDNFDFQISDQWIADRTEMLTRKNWFNNTNLNPVNASAGTNGQSGQTTQTLSPYQTDNVLFIDETTGYKIAQGFSPDSPMISTHRYYFGDSANNTYSGGMAEDHLYGGGGTDVLSGGGDRDYLDGGDGNDLILGGWGADTIKGGTGDNWIFGSSTGLVDAPSSTSFPTPTLSGTELASTVKPETTLEAVMQQFDTMRATDYAAHITYQPLKHAARRFSSISSLNAHAALLGSQHALQHQQTQHA